MRTNKLITLIALSTLTTLISCSEPTDTPTPTDPTTDATTFVTVKALEYKPAPGQFVNEIPDYTTGDSYEDILVKAESYLNNKSVITLGSLGGYITLKLDTPILNITDSRDFRVLGNAFYSTNNVGSGGSAEPGIIYVMSDDNNNSLPDDTWYQIKGSETTTTETISYTRPTIEENGELIDNYITNPTYIAWQTTTETGFMPKINQHTQSYYPAWETADNLIFTNIDRLPNNSERNETTGEYFIRAWDYGYADNQPNNVEASTIDLDWAVDANGNPVTITKIDFIRIVSATLQFNGLLGEISTEVAGIESLNQ